MIDRLLQQISNPSANTLTVNTRAVRKQPSLAKKNKTNKYSQSTNQYLPNFLNRNTAKPIVNKECVVRINIWETESTQQMFDYESKKHIKTRDYMIDDHYDLYASGLENENKEMNKINCKLVKAGVYNSNTHCGRIESFKDRQYFISGSNINSYKVVGDHLRKASQLKVGTVLKIGRMQYIVQETYNTFNHKLEINQNIKNTNNSSRQVNSLPSGTCKFCLCDETDNPDILISPCKCKGSCAQVHINCLKQWLINKVSRKSTEYVEYLNYDNFSCQLCKQELPNILKVDGKTYNMLKQQSERNCSYIVLQGQPNKKCSTKNNLTITLKFLSQKSLSIGRGHEADIRLQDVSISRLHCFIENKNNQFTITDNKSKFGTLIKLMAGQKTNMNENKIQIGRITLEIGDKKILKAENRQGKQNMY